MWALSRAAPGLFQNSPGHPETPLCYTKTEKCKWFQYRCDFVGMDVSAGVTQPEYSINEVFTSID